jgi:hypothetical protein
VDDNSVILWNGLTNNQAENTAMDNFCMACHDNDGASNIASILALNSPQATPLNPFGDKISNGYDQVSRGRVVNVFSQFSTGNMSHHAVRGAKYNARTTADAVLAGKMKNPNAPSDKFDPKSQSSVTGQNTLYSAGMFTSYIPQGATQSVADNSTLHCGDCHTVGQLNYGDNPASAGNSLNKVAIGAHGSANAYMLRNSNGTDALHCKSTYVCYNCHNNLYNGYLANLVTVDNTDTSGYYSGGGAAGKATHGPIDSGCQIGTATASGSSNTTPGNLTYNGGNITGISCTNCHNSGRTGFGGIHGGTGTYKSTWTAYTSASKTQKALNGAVTPTDVGHYRFMGGMGENGYKPLGGNWNWDGGIPNNTYLDSDGNVRANDANGDTVIDAAGPDASATTGGCYTNKLAGDSAGWSSCTHHSTANGTSSAAISPTRKSSLGHVGRPLDY